MALSNDISGELIQSESVSGKPGLLINTEGKGPDEDALPVNTQITSPYLPKWV